MITTITLNPALDKTYLVHRTQVNHPHRVSEVIAVPGGKGINVAKVARTLGASVTASGLLGGANGSLIHRGLENLGIVSDFVWMEANTRETVTVFDEKGTITEFWEPGPVASEADLWKLEAKVRQLAGRSTVMTFSGSVVPGLPMDVYARLIRIAKRQGALTILDASGEHLSASLEGVPDICKPNRDELAQLYGADLPDAEAVVEAAGRLLERGIRRVVVSLDKDGSIAVGRDTVWRVEAPAIQVQNPVGCGDALVAGIACHLDRMGGWADGAAWIEALKWGTAAAASNALHRHAGHVRPEEVERFRRQVRVEEL